MRYTFLNQVKKSIGLLLLGSIQILATDNMDGAAIIDAKCSSCHIGSVQNGLSRISDQRKTPEAWSMSITRMQRSNGLVITNDEKKEVIKYLSETQGITPSESEEYRYILEQEPNVQELTHDSLFTEMCNRCHSAARVGLQRRTKMEWNKLIDFHMGYFPTLEYQALSRDRDWRSVAKEEIVPYLTKEFPLDKEKWEEWEQKISSVNIEGKWILSGHTLGKGEFSAMMKLIKDDKGTYTLNMNGKYLDGEEFTGTGKATLFSGYELRSSLTINGIKYKQVFSIDSQNNTLNGRMYETLHKEEGSRIKGLHSRSTKSSILSVFPKALKTGTSNTITIIGNNLKGEISLPKGVSIKEVIKQNSNEIVLSTYTSSNTDTKISDIKVGDALSKKALTTYKKVDSLKVLPSYAIARVGDGGGKTPKQHAVFEAYGFNSGADGKIGTEDDIPLGVLNSTWKIEPFDDIAKADKDIEFVGSINNSNGRFIPSFAGLNPKRKFSTNNAGNLKVIANYKDGEKSLKDESHLIVTIQRWVNAPIN